MKEARAMQSRAETFVDMVIALEDRGIGMDAIDRVAQAWRAECLSGYTWNVPANWDDVHHEAKLRWRLRAAHALRSGYLR